MLALAAQPRLRPARDARLGCSTKAPGCSGCSPWLLNQGSGRPGMPALAAQPRLRPARDARLGCSTKAPACPGCSPWLLNQGSGLPGMPALAAEAGLRLARDVPATTAHPRVGSLQSSPPGTQTPQLQPSVMHPGRPDTSTAACSHALRVPRHLHCSLQSCTPGAQTPPLQPSVMHSGRPDTSTAAFRPAGAPQVSPNPRPSPSSPKKTPDRAAIGGIPKGGQLAAHRRGAPLWRGMQGPRRPLPGGCGGEPPPKPC
jgi:hypothetical protein